MEINASKQSPQRDVILDTYISSKQSPQRGVILDTYISSSKVSINAAIYDNLSCVFLTIYKLINNWFVIDWLFNTDFGEGKFV